ncbi:MAG: hypothetical protein WA705_14315 [Candidatus Ozemobacteraceae bacterium]
MSKKKKKKNEDRRKAKLLLLEQKHAKDLKNFMKNRVAGIPMREHAELVRRNPTGTSGDSSPKDLLRSPGAGTSLPEHSSENLLKKGGSSRKFLGYTVYSDKFPTSMSLWDYLLSWNDFFTKPAPGPKNSLSPGTSGPTVTKKLRLDGQTNPAVLKTGGNDPILRLTPPQLPETFSESLSKPELKGYSGISEKPLNKLLRLCGDTKELCEFRKSEEGNSFIRIPQWGSLQGFLLAVLIVTGCAILAWPFFLKQKMGLAGGWFVNDMVLIFFVSLFFRSQIEHYYQLAPEAKTLHYLYRNPFYFERREISSQEVAGILTTGTIQTSLFLFHERVNVSSVLVLRNGVTLTVLSRECPREEYVKTFHQQMERTKALAECMEWPLFGRHLMHAGDSMAWRAAMTCRLLEMSYPSSLAQVLWEHELSSVALSPISGTIDEVRVDLATGLEKILLGVVVAVFAYTTGFFLSNEWALLKDNPRVFYLLLLDASSIVVSILAAWRWLIDEHYVIDVKQKQVLFFSRILLFQRRTAIASFSEVVSIRIRARNNNLNDQEYYAELRLREGRSLQFTDVSTSRELVQVKVLALAGLIGCPCSDGTLSEKVS